MIMLMLMIYLITDTYYSSGDEGSSDSIAIVAAIRFEGIKVHKILSEHVTQVNGVAPYQSGQFYKRELPCILALLEQINQPYDCIIIDGYVYLDGLEQAGLGKYLYDNLADKKPVLGIAKQGFKGVTESHTVFRVSSKHPLYVTSIGIDVTKAKALVSQLSGNHRLPDIVKQVDRLSRAN